MTKKNTDIFFSDPRLPFAEGRCSRDTVRTFRDHMHRSFSIGAVKTGRVCYRVGDMSEVLVPGDLAFINPETLHSCNTQTGEGRSFYMLYLDLHWCFQVQQSLWDIDTFVPAASIRLNDKPLHDQYIHTMECFFDQETTLLEKEQLLFDFAAAAFTTNNILAQRAARQDASAGATEKLKELLASDLAEEKTLQTLARQVDANPYTLLRRFKANTGITPHAFRLNCRIEQARKYLQQGMDIGEVAFLCGFFDQSHLHRHFKAMTTLTPKEYQVNFIQ